MEKIKPFLCEICNQLDSTGKQLAIDHCHKTGKLRGRLCSRCNTGLGMFLDSEALLQRAIKYLRDSRGTSQEAREREIAKREFIEAMGRDEACA